MENGILHLICCGGLIFIWLFIIGYSKLKKR